MLSALLLAPLLASAAPLDLLAVAGQVAFQLPPAASSAAPTLEVHALAIENKLSPLHHLSAISPWNDHVRTPTAPPPTCRVAGAALLIRHSAIMGNDDEFEQTMQPFLEKIKNLPAEAFPPTGNDGPRHPWAFLQDHQSPIIEATLEELSPRGSKDAASFGAWARKHYDDLFPPARPAKDIKKKHKGKKHDSKKNVPYKVWTASSPRDIDSAKAWIQGAFPANQTGKEGEGDGETVQLIEVPNKGFGSSWKESLTPHKACKAFEKESSLKPASKWLAIYSSRVRERLMGVIPGVAKELVDMDILAMQMLCGYESIAVGDSPFCHVFTDEEWLDAEYWFDIRTSYMLGYQQPLAPYLGLPWVQTAAHLLEGKVADDGDHSAEGDLKKKKKKDKGGKQEPLPTPKLPPNGTHTQELHPFFTHRESPGFVAVALNLFNSSLLGPDLPPSSVPPPLDHRPPAERQWRSSHVIQFLAHIALERLECDSGSYVRALVNGKFEPMGGCDQGVGQTCDFDQFLGWLEVRSKVYGDFDGVCDKKDE